MRRTHIATPEGITMDGKTDNIRGRANQAARAVSGDEKLRRGGKRGQDRRRLKGSIDDAVKKAQAALGQLRGKAERR